MRLTTASAPDLLPASFTTTDAPSAARCSAMAAPMPLDAPVTTATLPLSRFMTHSPLLRPTKLPGTAIPVFQAQPVSAETEQGERTSKTALRADCHPRL